MLPKVIVGTLCQTFDPLLSILIWLNITAHIPYRYVKYFHEVIDKVTLWIEVFDGSVFELLEAEIVSDEGIG